MIEEKIKKIRLLLLDVDGVLTDGRVIYNDDGTEIKAFNVKDGLGLRLLMNAGIKTGVVTGRRSNALIYRCKNIGIHYVFDGISEKGKLLETIVSQTEILPEEIAFMGDDLPDIPLLKKIGVPIAVRDAHENVIDASEIVTEKRGGDGAVREICEKILKVKGLWDQSINDFIG
ncbi:MAG: HAD hydrolase family protein [Proteobacteria bacterium]|nr:HAD hydrolase family protein [Pseudomonadota bacterium]